MCQKVGWYRRKHTTQCDDIVAWLLLNLTHQISWYRHDTVTTVCTISKKWRVSKCFCNSTEINTGDSFYSKELVHSLRCTNIKLHLVNGNQWFLLQNVVAFSFEQVHNFPIISHGQRPRCHKFNFVTTKIVKHYNLRCHDEKFHQLLWIKFSTFPCWI